MCTDSLCSEKENRRTILVPNNDKNIKETLYWPNRLCYIIDLIVDKMV